MIFKILGLSLISYSVSAIVTKFIYNNSPKKQTPDLELEMEIILEENNYVSLEEWREENAISKNN